MLVWVLSNDLDSYSDKKFLKAAQEKEIELELINPTDVDVIVTSHSKKSVFINGRGNVSPDVVIPRMGADSTYYTLSLIRHFERLNTIVINGSQGIELVKDKLQSLQVLAEAGIPVPKTILSTYPVDIEKIEKLIGFPLIIKLISGTQGKGVLLVKNKEELINFLNFYESVRSDLTIIFQEFIETSFGQDLRVMIIGNKIIGCMHRQSRNGSFRANISAGGDGSNYELTDEIEWLALSAANKVGLDITGVDILFDKDSYKICEINSAPGWEGFEKCHPAINVASLILDYAKIKTRGA